jgi:acetoin utilization deacetylase AcuC-like enzyme|tara:strand:- start:2649 stop:3647 length:999 start_codon:yes stop_codon:yes gene_type:complete
MIIYSEQYKEHDLMNHPENSLRLNAIMKVLSENNVFEKIPIMEPKLAKRKDILRVHLPEHLETIKSLADNGGGDIGMDTYINSSSYKIGLLSAGSILTCVDKYHEGFNNTFSINRPPGHHADINQVMGFCLFNNIAIGAKYAIEKYKLKRLLILDLDVHHGNGTQNIFYTDPRVFYISLHQHPHYPGTGMIEEIGEGKGEGFNLNVPLINKTCDKSYLKVIDEIVIPIIKSFKPELILVSAGYDTHHRDPLGGINLSEASYYSITTKLKKSSTAGIIFCLEGGYNLDALSQSVYATMLALFDLGKKKFESPIIEDREVTKFIDARIEYIKNI